MAQMSQMEQLRKQLEDNEAVVVEWYSSLLSIQQKHPDCPNLISLYEKQYLNAKTISEVIRENIQRLQNHLQKCIPPKKRKLSVMCCSEDTEPVPKSKPKPKPKPKSKPNKRKLTPPQSESEHDSECNPDIEPRKVPQNTFNGMTYPMFRRHQIKGIRQKHPEITFSEMMKKIGRRWARYKQQHKSE